MVIVSNNEWEHSDRSGLVSIGTHSLFVSTAGPPRRPGAPVVVFITGGGAPTEVYAHLHSAVSGFVRNYFYDRTGYGRSERGGSPDNSTARIDQLDEANLQKSSVSHPVDKAWWVFGGKRSVSLGSQDTPKAPMDDCYRCHKITAEDSAHDLHHLMHAIRVEPPFLLVAHSFGGIIARTYFGLFPQHVAGIALLDTSSELLQQCLSPMPPLAYQKVIIDVDLEKVLHLREESGMSDEEWEAAMAAVERTAAASADEDTHGSGRNLARMVQLDRQSMGQRPLLVMRSDLPGDWRLLFEEGMRLGAGKGTEADVREAKFWLESAELYCAQIQRAQLELSGNSEYVFFSDTGHDFPIRDPQRTAEVIRRLITMFKRATP